MEELKEQGSRVTYSFGPFHLDPAERRLSRDGRDLRLAPKVFETLVHLVEHHGLLVEKDDLMKALWSGMYVEEVTLARNISLLRKALDDSPGQDQSQYIETVSKRGYRFIADVKKLDQSEAPSQELYNIKSQRKRRAWVAVFGPMLLLAGVGAFWGLNASRNSATPIRSLAVLPLENLSADPDQEYFADGMTDQLIADLAQIHSLRVISRTSVMQFKHTKKTLPEIAAALNVDAIVEGSVSRASTNVHITAQLLDARQDRHLWAASYDRQMADILFVQTQVAKAIADQVKAKLTPEEYVRITKRPPRNPEAYDALLKGRFLWNRGDPATSKKALAYFQQAVAIDPNYADAWAALGNCYTELATARSGQDPAELRPKAHEAIAKALELDPDLADAHSAFGYLTMWYDWDWTGAEREFRRAIELNPNNSTAHLRYAIYLRFRKRFDEAVEENRRATELAPLDILPHSQLATIYKAEGLADKTIEQSKRVLEMDPNFTHAYFNLGLGYELKGQWSDALAAYAHVSKPKDVYYLAGHAHAFAATGKKQKAEEAMAELSEFAKHNYVDPTIFAEYYGEVGDRDRALQWLEKAYREHVPGMIGLEIDDSYDSLRSDPRFQDLERRVGFR